MTEGWSEAEDLPDECDTGESWGEEESDDE